MRKVKGLIVGWERRRPKECIIYNYFFRVPLSLSLSQIYENGDMKNEKHILPLNFFSTACNAYERLPSVYAAKWVDIRKEPFYTISGTM